MKAEKNTVEREGMQNAHIRDAVAFCACLSIIEEDVSSFFPFILLMLRIVDYSVYLRRLWFLLGKSKLFVNIVLLLRRNQKIKS